MDIDYDEDLIEELLSPLERCPIPNEPPPPPYTRASFKADNLYNEVSIHESNAMQSKIRSVVARLAQSNLNEQLSSSNIENNGGQVSSTIGGNSGVKKDTEAQARKKKMQEVRAATVQRINGRQTEMLAADKRRQIQEEEELQKLRKTRKEELGRIKQQREVMLKAVQRDPPISTELVKRADRHYRRYLLVNYGLSPWLQILNAARLSEDKAIVFATDRLLHYYFRCWKIVWANIKHERRKKNDRLNVLAVTYYKRQLLRFVWRKWKLYRKLLKAKALTVGGQFSRHSLRRRAFLSWKIAYDRLLRQYTSKIITVALPFRRRTVCRQCFTLWLNYIQQVQFDRDVQARADLTWNKVQGWMANSNYRK